MKSKSKFNGINCAQWITDTRGFILLRLCLFNLQFWKPCSERQRKWILLLFLTLINYRQLFASSKKANCVFRTWKCVIDLCLLDKVLFRTDFRSARFHSLADTLTYILYQKKIVEWFCWYFVKKQCRKFCGMVAWRNTPSWKKKKINRRFSAGK